MKIILVVIACYILTACQSTPALTISSKPDVVQVTPTVAPTPLPTYPLDLPTPDPEMAKEYIDCLAQRGRWEALGLLNGLGCNYPTTDSGKPCTEDKDCQGACIANPEEFPKKRETPGSLLPIEEYIKQLDLQGKWIETCSSFQANFGCHYFLENGQLGIVCID